MKPELIDFSQRYVTALDKHLKQGLRASSQPAVALGREAVAFGMETLELARIHEGALSTLDLSRSRNGVLKLAESFFSEAITPIVETHRAARQSKTDLSRLNETLKRRTRELATTNRQLHNGITRRKSVEAALKNGSKRYTLLLKESLQLQKDLRRLTHQLMAAQEEERRKISRELQDEIGQTLLGINVRLHSIKQEARINTKGFKREIVGTQRLVKKSVRSIRRFAHELDLRPPA